MFVCNKKNSARRFAAITATVFMMSHALADPVDDLPDQAEKQLSMENDENQSNGSFRQDAHDVVRHEPLRINPGDKRPADQFQVDIFDHPLTIGGAYELEPRYTEDRRLDPDRDDDVADISQDLKLEFFYEWNSSVSLFIQSDYYYNPEVYVESGSREHELGAKLTQGWFFAYRILDSDLSLQVGRQRIADKRQWWWNEELDAVRVYYGEPTIFAELAVSKELDTWRSDQSLIDPLHKNVLRVLGDVLWQWDDKQNLSLFFLTQFDNSSEEQLGDLILEDRVDQLDGDLTWIGFRALGKVKFKPLGKFRYWLDSAIVFGKETNLQFEEINDTYQQLQNKSTNDVLGWGLDAGITWYSRWVLEPYFTLGYAYGSGDSDLDNGKDGNYRQSGVHNNKNKFSGSQRFRYYGELFRPELSNIGIVTAALGFPLSEHSSIDFLYHHYHQVEPSTVLRDSRIRATPNGRQTELGDELDLVVSIDEWKQLQLQFSGALFIAGDAFDDLAGNESFQFIFTAKYSF